MNVFLQLNTCALLGASHLCSQSSKDSFMERKDKTMKNMKKFSAIVLAIVMVLMYAVPMSVMAEDEAPAYDKPLTVTGLATGDTAHFYQVIEWVGETTDDSDVAGWKAKAPFADYLTKAKLTEILVGTPAVKDDPETTDVNESKEAVPATGITSEIAGELAKLASGDGTAVAESSGTATLQNTESGMWMALIDPADANTVYNPVFVSADYNKETGHEGTIAMTDSFDDSVAKKSTLTLTKTAANSADYNGDNAKTTAVGDTVTFTVNTTIPGYGFVYTNPHFVLTDTLTDLQLKTDTVTLTAPTGLKKKGAEGVADTDADYEVKATTGGYTITFTEKYLKTVNSATSVTVTYDAIVTDSAANAVNEEDNDVYIEYSHNPNNQSDYDVKKDTTQHYTFSIDAEGAGEGQTVNGKRTSEVVKIGVKADGTPITQRTETSEITDTETWTGPLEGAVFGLFTDKNCTKPYKAKNTDGTAGETAMTATTGEDGRMNFAGLDAGTYYLKEISAPAGYVTQTSVHTVVIAAETEKVNVTEWWNGSAWVSTKPTSGTAKEVTYETEVLKSYTVTIDGEETAKYTFTNAKETNSNEINWTTANLVEHPFELENTQGTELPSTGGIGTTIFYILGTILVIGAGVLLVTRRRMRASEE